MPRELQGFEEADHWVHRADLYNPAYDIVWKLLAPAMCIDQHSGQHVKLDPQLLRGRPFD